MAVGCPLHHLQDFYGCPEIFYTIQGPMYEGQHCHHKLFIIWKVLVAFLPILKQNLMFALCSIIMNCHNNLQSTKSSTRLSMNDKREVTDIVQGT
jgi:hypothetical protein